MMATKLCKDMEPSDILSEAAIMKKLKLHPNWNFDSNGHLSRRLEVIDFQAAIDFILQASVVAEKRVHHPDIHLTRYKHLELVLYTYKVGGVTDEDFKMVEYLDAIPVAYSKKWIKKHKDIISEPGHRILCKIPLNGDSRDENSPSNDHKLESRSVHSSKYSDSGQLLHDRDFRVHTGSSVLLGRSDAPHYEIKSTRTGPMSYETETEHANEQVLRFPVDHHQHGQDYFNSAPIANSIVPASLSYPADDVKIWDVMVMAMTDLIERGFDVGNCEAYLPMMEAHTIFPDMESDIFSFYQHLQRRVTPEWQLTEPMEVVATAQQFIEAYEALKGIKHA